MIGNIVDLIRHVVHLVVAIMCFYYGGKCGHFEMSILLIAVGFLLLR